jgi:mono/diheme cytochrome c family protein
MSGRVHTRWCAAGVTAACALLLGACGGGSDSGSQQGNPQTQTPSGGAQTQAAPTQQAVNGKAVFTKTCGGCHTLADAGTHGQTGPDLDQLQPDEATVVHQVTNGGGGMPAFNGRLSQEEISAVAAYVSKQAGGS